jgi:hypothetical protein
MPLGSQTTKVSTREELLKLPVVSGAGAPTHKPEIAAQEYYDVNSAVTVYIWSAGVWSDSVFVV